MADDTGSFNGESPDTKRTLRLVGGIDDMRAEIQALQLVVKGARWTKVILGALSGAFMAGVMLVVYYYNLETKSHANEIASQVAQVKSDHAVDHQALYDLKEMVKDIRDDVKTILRGHK